MGANISVLKNCKSHSLFKSVQEKDLYVRRVLYTYANQISDSFKEVLLCLSGYSCVVVGVSWLKHGVIAKDTGVSVSTVKRAISFFQKLGVLKVENRLRTKKGGKGANMYILTPIPNLSKLPDELSHEPSEMNYRQATEKPDGSKENRQFSTREYRSFKKVNLEKKKQVKHGNIEVSKPVTSDLELSLPKSIPTDFVQLVSQHYPKTDALIIYKLWGVAKRAFKKLNMPVDPSVVTDAFLETFWKHKVGKVKSTFSAYMFGTIKRMLQSMKYELLQRKLQDALQQEDDDSLFMGEWLFLNGNSIQTAVQSGNCTRQSVSLCGNS